MMSSAGRLGVALIALSLCAQAHQSNKGKRHRHRHGWVNTAEVLEQYGGPGSGASSSESSSGSSVLACELLGSCSLSGMPGGLAWDGTHYWYADFFALQLHQVDPATCTVVRSIPAPGAYIGGVAWDGSNLWCAPEQSGELYQLDPQTGDVLHVIPAPSFGAADPNGSGLAWDGSSLWHADYGTRRIYQLDPATGSILSEFMAPGSMPTGLGYASGALFLADPVTDLTYTIDPSDGTLISSCPAPDSHAIGVTVDGDGNMLTSGWGSRAVHTTTTLAPPEADPWENYCQSSTNSTGSAATMAAGGSTSVEANNLVLYASPVPDRVGVFFYGPNRTERPFGNGFLCVGGPSYRLGVTRGVGNVMAMPVKPGRIRCRGNFTVGTVWNFQTWFREGKYGRRRGFNTSDGLSVTLEP